MIRDCEERPPVGSKLCFFGAVDCAAAEGVRDETLKHLRSEVQVFCRSCAFARHRHDHDDRFEKIDDVSQS